MLAPFIDLVNHDPGSSAEFAYTVDPASEGCAAGGGGHMWLEVTLHGGAGRGRELTLCYGAKSNTELLLRHGQSEARLDRGSNDFGVRRRRCGLVDTLHVGGFERLMRTG